MTFIQIDYGTYIQLEEVFSAEVVKTNQGFSIEFTSKSLITGRLSDSEGRYNTKKLGRNYSNRDDAIDALDKLMNKSGVRKEEA